MITHLQARRRGFHALDVLAPQNEMQRYHLDSEGILEYINDLEDAQAKAADANNPITYLTIFITATNAMVSTDKFSQPKMDWEEIEVT